MSAVANAPGTVIELAFRKEFPVLPDDENKFVVVSPEIRSIIGG